MNHVSVLASKTVRLLQHGGERDPYHDLCAADHAFEVKVFLVQVVQMYIFRLLAPVVVVIVVGRCAWRCHGHVYVHADRDDADDAVGRGD